MVKATNLFLRDKSTIETPDSPKQTNLTLEMYVVKTSLLCLLNVCRSKGEDHYEDDIATYFVCKSVLPY